MDCQDTKQLLAAYSQAACEHAQNRYHIQLDDNNLAAIDAILSTESQGDSDEAFSSLIFCYGAWIGEWMIRNLNGYWVGIDEPVPPRVVVNGHLYCPMDAVERKLLKKSSSNFVALLGTLRSNKSAHPTFELAKVIERNKIAWDSKVNNSRFVSRDDLPSHRQQAIQSLDPWVRNEKFDGASVLCLAAAGGTHAPLFAIAGANVTVIDLSPKQLAIDRCIADQLGLPIRTLESSMDDLHMVNAESFDIVIQPVSSCYVQDVKTVYQEVARVLKIGGLYLSQHKQPNALQANLNWTEEGGYAVGKPLYDGQQAVNPESLHPFRESGVNEFIHSLDSLLGGLCQSGFHIEDFQEPSRGDMWAAKNSFEHRSHYLPPYLKIKARKQSRKGNSMDLKYTT